ncbi:MAG TPA: DUF1697 domain-containing protein [Actinomycetota bacterium]|nr:DUF1697 domain-containing protein [Actinomycetota bacterium]
MTRYVALLRGINVGGKNPIRMADLKGCFEQNGFEGVATFIQSGNVVFDARGGGQSALTERIEAMLAATFDYEPSVVVRSQRQMRDIVERAPEGFGADPAAYRYDVVFLKPPLTARQAMRSVHTRDGVDRAWAGSGVVYFSRLTSRAAQSYLSRVVSMPIYQSMTIRNWNTTTTLLRMLDGSPRARSTEREDAAPIP